MFNCLLPRICETAGAISEKDTNAAAEVIKVLDCKAAPIPLPAAETSYSDDDWCAAMDGVEEQEVKVSPKWIKEDSVKQEYKEDGDDDDEDYDPPFRVNAKAEKSPKKERNLVSVERIRCKKCPKAFTYQAAYNKHVQKHKEEDEGDDSDDDDEDTSSIGGDDISKFHCEEGCEGANNGRRSFYKFETSLVRHYMRIHEKPKDCCGETYTVYKVYRRHLTKFHHNFQCAECAETFYRKEQLERHQKWQHETEPQKCPVCPAVIKDVDMHMKNCHTGDLMTCSACPYSSRRKADIEQHYRKVHTDLNKKTCPVCGETFKGLKLHLERTKCGTGKKAEANIPCPEGCPKMFTLQSTVDKHIRQVHLQIKNKICPFCDYKTYSRFNLNLHVTKMHEGKKMEKQQCLYCDKTPFALDYHMQTYHNDKI